MDTRKEEYVLLRIIIWFPCAMQHIVAGRGRCKLC